MFLNFFFGIETMENHNVQCWVNQLDPGIAPFGSFAHCAAWQGIQLVEKPRFFKSFSRESDGFPLSIGVNRKTRCKSKFWIGK